MRVDRNLVLVAAHNGQSHLPSRGPEIPATGDWVWLGSNPVGEPAIVSVLPRRSELSRKRAFEASSEAQVLGANMDLVGVVVPVDRPLTHNRLERTLVAAWDSGATPLVVITKADLAEWRTTSSGRSCCRPPASTWSPPRPNTATASTTARDTFRPAAPSCCSARRARQITLINALVGFRAQETGAVRSGDGKGRHTTTSRELVRCRAARC